MGATSETNVGPPRAPRNLVLPSTKAAARAVIDPELGDNIVDLGMVRSVAGRAGAARSTVVGRPHDRRLSAAGPDRKRRRERGIVGAISPACSSVEILMGEM